MKSDPDLSAEQSAQLRLLEALAERGYEFVPVTPESQSRVLARPGFTTAKDLRGVFGWSLPFAEGMIDPEIVGLADAAGLLRPHSLGLASSARVSSVRGRLFLHSAFPTEEEDSVFLGPDSCRFVDFVLAHLAERAPFKRLVDIGAGNGVGAITVAAELGGRVELADVNLKALAFAEVNAAAAGVAIDIVESDGLEKVAAGFDVAIANPPFIFEENAPFYRGGGGMHGAQKSFDWAIEAAGKLAPGGCIFLYTGSAIVDGVDRLRARLEEKLPALNCGLEYREIDPDIFGEELAKPAYANVERIAAIGAVIEKRGDRP